MDTRIRKHAESQMENLILHFYYIFKTADLKFPLFRILVSKVSEAHDIYIALCLDTARILGVSRRILVSKAVSTF